MILLSVTHTTGGSASHSSGSRYGMGADGTSLCVDSGLWFFNDLPVERLRDLPWGIASSWHGEN